MRCFVRLPSKICLISLGFTILSFAISLWGIFHYPAICRDDFTRVYWAAMWNFPKLIQVPSWLPLYSWVYGFVLKTGVPPLLTCRVITGLLSALLLFVIGNATYRHTGRLGAAIGALIFSTFLSLRMWISFSALSEPLFALLLFISADQLLVWEKQKKSSHLFLGLIPLSLASCCRFNAWLLLIFAACWLGVICRFPLRVICLVLLFLFLFPLIWFAISYNRFGDPLVSFHYQQFDSAEFFGASKLSYGIVPFAFLIHSPLAPIVLLVSLLTAKKTKGRNRIIVGAGFIFVLMEFLLVAGQPPTVLPERAMYVSALWVSILMGIGLDRLWHKGYRILALSFAASMVVWGSWKTYRMTPDFSKEAIEAGMFLSRSPSFQRLVATSLVGSNLSHGDFVTAAVASDHPRQWVYLPDKNSVSTILPRLRIPIRAFVSKEKLPESKTLGNFYIASNDPGLMQELK